MLLMHLLIRRQLRGLVTDKGLVREIDEMIINKHTWKLSYFMKGSFSPLAHQGEILKNR